MENNNAKNSVLIINNLPNLSLQVSLQKQLLNFSLQRTSRLQPSLQLQAVCKGNRAQYKAYANSFVCSFVCRNLKLTKA